MSYRITKARKLQETILDIQQDLKLNAKALAAATDARSEKYIIHALVEKDNKLKRKLEKATKKFYKYADDNLKISDLSKLNGEEIEDPFDDYYE